MGFLIISHIWGKVNPCQWKEPEKDQKRKTVYSRVELDPLHMMTSSNGNPFRVTGPLCGEFTGHRWIPRTWRGALMFTLMYAWRNGWANNRDAGDLRRHRAHYDVTVMTRWHHDNETLSASLAICEWNLLAAVGFHDKVSETKICC